MRCVKKDKKLWQKRFNDKRSREGQKRKKHRHSKTPPRRKEIRRDRKKSTITAPSVFSVVHGGDDTIVFFTALMNAIRKKRDITVHLANITEITPDAILYLLLLVEEGKMLDIHIEGDVPQDENARHIFLCSGFYEYVISNAKNSTPNDNNILTIKKGEQVEGEIAAEMQQYLADRIKSVNPRCRKALYSILVECMANTNGHASIEGQNKKNWWAMGLHNKTLGKVLFAFVDNGLGIPATMRRNIIEKMPFSDADMLEKSVTGRYDKASSGESTRNKGLPQIKRLSDNGFIENLILISSKGYYSAKSGRKILRKRFKGTLITWEFRG